MEEKRRKGREESREEAWIGGKGRREKGREGRREDSGGRKEGKMHGKASEGREGAWRREGRGIDSTVETRRREIKVAGRERRSIAGRDRWPAQVSSKVGLSYWKVSQVDYR